MTYSRAFQSSFGLLREIHPKPHETSCLNNLFISSFQKQDVQKKIPSNNTAKNESISPKDANLKREECIFRDEKPQ